jgi:hypothetical protein
VILWRHGRQFWLALRQESRLWGRGRGSPPRRTSFALAGPIAALARLGTEIHERLAVAQRLRDLREVIWPRREIVVEQMSEASRGRRPSETDSSARRPFKADPAGESYRDGAGPSKLFSRNPHPG